MNKLDKNLENFERDLGSTEKFSLLKIEKHNL